ncbi:hypothetical protein A0U90_10890 [Kozakia baliensis]|nr:hypothetical protein A0U90_10890 [Kozakia baliensis]
MYKFFVACLCFFAFETQAATLRSHVILHGEKVHLSDIFDGIDKEQDTELGDAPELGQSYVVSGTQLTAIAAQFNLDWPDASPLVSTTITRDARIFSREEILALLRTSLGLPAASTDTQIELNDTKPLVFPREQTAQPYLKDVVYTPESNGAFSATLALDQLPSFEFALSGRVVHTRSVLVLRLQVLAGNPIQLDDLEILARRDTNLPADILHESDEAVGFTARTTLMVGQSLRASQLVHPILIEKNAPIVMSFVTPAMRVTATGVALESGSRNETIRAVNPSAHVIIVGRVVDRAQIEILPGSTPIPMDQHTDPLNKFGRL